MPTNKSNPQEDALAGIAALDGITMSKPDAMALAAIKGRGRNTLLQREIDTIADLVRRYTKKANP
jgi:hypothetical protein